MAWVVRGGRGGGLGSEGGPRGGGLGSEEQPRRWPG